MVSMTPKQREQFAALSEGKTIAVATWDDEERYWVLRFTDGTELCVRLVVDDVAGEKP